MPSGRAGASSLRPPRVPGPVRRARSRGAQVRPRGTTRGNTRGSMTPVSSTSPMNITASFASAVWLPTTSDPQRPTQAARAVAREVPENDVHASSRGLAAGSSGNTFSAMTRLRRVSSEVRGSGGSAVVAASRTLGRTANRSTTTRRSGRIRALAIPPAWTDVWICPDPLRPPAGVGDRRRRPAAVPVPRALAGPARRREVRPDAEPSRTGCPQVRERVSGRPRAPETCRARRPSRRPCGCSTSRCSASAPSPTRGTTGRSGSRRSGGTTSGTSGDARPVRLPRQERPTADPGGRGRRDRPHRPDAQAPPRRATPSCSRTATARAGATCVRRTSTRT